MADTASPSPRGPIAPHLQVYRPTLTMVMSIAHRLTGIALYAGTVVFVWWLVAVAAGRAAYDAFLAVFGSPPGLVVLFGLTWAVLHHALGGIRHLIWDAGRAHTYPWREYLARANLVGSLMLTAILWAVFYPR